MLQQPFKCVARFSRLWPMPSKPASSNRPRRGAPTSCARPFSCSAYGERTGRGWRCAGSDGNTSTIVCARRTSTLAGACWQGHRVVVAVDLGGSRRRPAPSSIWRIRSAAPALRVMPAGPFRRRRWLGSARGVLERPLVQVGREPAQQSVQFVDADEEALVMQLF